MPVPAEWRVLLLGVFGSLSVEVLNIVRVYEVGRPLSVRYKRPVFVITRLLMAGIGGVLAWAYHINNDILAIHIGASAPLILQSLARTPHDGDTGPTEKKSPRPPKLPQLPPLEEDMLGSLQPA